MLTGKFKFFLAIFGVILFWSLATPLYEFPDEQSHAGTVNFLAQEGRPPEGNEPDMTKEMWATQQYLGVLRNELGHNRFTYHPEYRLEYTQSLLGKYEADIIALNTRENREQYVGVEAARYPRLYYDYLRVFLQTVSNQDIITRTFAMRVGNTLLTFLTALVVYHIGQLLFASNSSSLVLTLLVMLQPMFSFVSAGINSDNLHNLLFAGVIYLGLQIVQSGLTLRASLLGGLVIILDIMSKPQGYLAIPVLMSAILVYIVVHKHWRSLLGVIVLGLVGIVALFGPGNRYRGWLLSNNIHNANLPEYLHFSLNQLVTQNIVWYWGVFKWLGVVLSPLYWQVANRLVLVSVIGLFVYLFRLLRRKSLITHWSNVLFLFLTSIIYAFAIYYFDYQYVKSVGYSIGIQARYLFPTIVAHLGLLMIGILSLSSKSKVQSWLLRGLVVFIFWLQLGGLWRLLSSYYDPLNLGTFIIQASQYKPFFAKGEWWYLWIALYLSSLSYLLYRSWRSISDRTS